MIAVDPRRRRSDSVSGSNEPCALARDLGDPTRSLLDHPTARQHSHQLFAMASARARQATSSDVDSGGALLTSDQSSPTHALAGNPYTVHFLQASKASYRHSQWASCEDYFPRDWMLAMWNVEPSQYTPRHRPFLEKHGSSLQNRCWLLLETYL